jgi:excisionase family DNA binding protein
MRATTPERIKTAEAARLLQLSPYTVGCMVRARRLPHYRIGRQVFFNRDELLAWLEAQHVPASDRDEYAR